MRLRPASDKGRRGLPGVRLSTEGWTPPNRVPTLTEVIEPSQLNAQQVHAAPASIVPRTEVPALLSEAQLVQRVMAELQQQVDVMLEYRVREVLGPLLARTADNLVRDVRSELASTLRDVVARAVANELARHRPR